MSHGKQFTLYTHDLTPPNGWYVLSPTSHLARPPELTPDTLLGK